MEITIGDITFIGTVDECIDFKNKLIPIQKENVIEDNSNKATSNSQAFTENLMRLFDAAEKQEKSRKDKQDFNLMVDYMQRFGVKYDLNSICPRRCRNANPCPWHKDNRPTNCKDCNLFVDKKSSLNIFTI